jgi:hypothetical protein
MAERLHAVLAPAILAAPGIARAGRRIAFPSRSEVRLAYTAVVTWKGYVLSQLSQSWIELRRLFARVGRHLAIQWEVVRQHSRELLESARLAERLAVLRPMIRRHGVLASVAMLCGAILLLGLTATHADPAAVSARPANAATAPSTATLALGALATSNAAAVDGAASGAAASGGGVSGEGARLTDPDPGAPRLNLPANAAEPDAIRSSEMASTSISERLVLRQASAENESARKESLADPSRSVAEGQPQGRPRAAVAQGESAEARPRGNANSAAGRDAVALAPKTEARKTEAAKTEAAAKGSVAPPAKPITKAMAQAATKILNADELVASLPAKKPAPRVPPRATRPNKPAPATAQAKSADPFDDRL